MSPATTNGPSPRGPLQSRNFRLLVACNVISVAGAAVSFVALPFAVLKIGGSASDVGYVATAKLVPLIVFLLLGGVVADRLPRHKVMAAANVLQALAQGTSAILVLTGQARVWQLVILAAAGGVGLGFYYPAAQGLLPQTVPPEQRPRANALDQTGQGAASIAGAAVGGLLIGLAGPGWGLAVDAATFAVAAALRIGMHRPPLAVGHRLAVRVPRRYLRRDNQRARAAGRRRPPRRCPQLGPHRRRLLRRRDRRRPGHDQVPSPANAARRDLVRARILRAAVRSGRAARRPAGHNGFLLRWRMPGSVRRQLDYHLAAGNTARKTLPHLLL
jgi:MFS family permease